MKKILGIIFLSLLWCNTVLADAPKYDLNSLDKNTIKGWKIKEITMVSYKDIHSEIYTLSKGNWVLKCQILYDFGEIETHCITP